MTFEEELKLKKFDFLIDLIKISIGDNIPNSVSFHKDLLKCNKIVSTVFIDNMEKFDDNTYYTTQQIADKTGQSLLTIQSHLRNWKWNNNNEQEKMTNKIMLQPSNPESKRNNLILGKVANKTYFKI